MRNYIIVLLCPLIILSSFFGACSQKDDILKPYINSSVILRPRNLPTLDSLLVYELWAVQDNGSDSGFVSMGKFTWDYQKYRFYDVDGHVRDSVFVVPNNYFDFDFFMVSVESKDDDRPTEPSGVVLLTADIVDPARNRIQLKFPVSMFGAIGSFLIGTPTDDTINTANENKGIWLCGRSQSSFAYYDTLGVTLDSITKYYIPNDPTAGKPDTIGFNPPPGGVWPIESTLVVASYDTIPIRKINVDWVTRVIPDTNYYLFLTYDIEPLPWYERDSADQILVNVYMPTMENLPDVGKLGWRYNCWVFHKYFPDMGLPKMIPAGVQYQNYLLGHPDWGVLSLGAIDDFNTADLSNLYNDTREVPNFPGEDFLTNLPPGFENINFRMSHLNDTLPGRYGVVVVGLEPRPEVLTSDTTRNFPLFVLSGNLPYLEDGFEEDYLFHNYSQLMPTIDVEVFFHE